MHPEKVHQLFSYSVVQYSVLLLHVGAGISKKNNLLLYKYFNIIYIIIYIILNFKIHLREGERDLKLNN